MMLYSPVVVPVGGLESTLPLGTTLPESHRSYRCDNGRVGVLRVLAQKSGSNPRVCNPTSTLLGIISFVFDNIFHI